MYLYFVQAKVAKVVFLAVIKKTRGPRGPWNAHLRVKIFKSNLFSLLYIQQATPGGSKSEVMFKKEFSKIWPRDLVFDLTWPIFEPGLDIIKTNLLTKFHQNRVANVASSVNKNFQWFDLVTYFLNRRDPYPNLA